MHSIQIFILVVNLSGIFAQNFVLYSSKDCTGIGQTVSAKDYVNLGDIGFDNKLNSIKIKGDWIFYDLPNFNTGADATVEYVSSPESTTCNNLVTTSGIASSVRSISYNDLDTFTLYGQTNFQGYKEFTTTEMYKRYTEPIHKSLTFDGSSPWTIFKSKNHEGPALCIYPEGNDGSPTFIPDLQKYTTPIPYDFIQSVHKGCLAPN